MRTRHITKLIEPYLDQQLSATEQQRVEAHLANCPECTRRLYQAQRLNNELGEMMQAALGQPSPPPALRRRVRRALQEAEPSRRPGFDWAMPGRILNAVGTAAIIALLAFAVFAVVQGRIPGINLLSEIIPDQPQTSEQLSVATSTSTPAPQPSPIATATLNLSSLGDTLPDVVSADSNAPGQREMIAAPEAQTNQSIQENQPAQQGLRRETTSPAFEPTVPGGTIAFAFFNPAAHRQTYEVHLIRPNGTNHRIFPLDGISEPALHRTDDGYELAFRAWGKPTRALLTSNLTGLRPNGVTNYWEDAQPDWSPTEDRIIFASQRESDRRWRLYTVWRDGSAEKDLRREGKSPTFAPDGKRFAFESCDETGNRCGLWVANLENAEYGAEPILKDPRAQSPDWSPSGEQIAYMANVDRNWDLYLVDSHGRNVRRLTESPAVDGLPVWSPDGEWLAFLSNRDGNWGIWIYHVASGQTQPVFAFDGGSFTPPAQPPYGERNWWDEQLSWSR